MRNPDWDFLLVNDNEEKGGNGGTRALQTPSMVLRSVWERIVEGGLAAGTDREPIEPLRT